MTPNQLPFVKSGVCKKRVKHRESVIFRGMHFDTVPVKSSARYLSACPKFAAFSNRRLDFLGIGHPQRQGEAP